MEQIKYKLGSNGVLAWSQWHNPVMLTSSLRRCSGAHVRRRHPGEDKYTEREESRQFSVRFHKVTFAMTTQDWFTGLEPFHLIRKRLS